MKILPIASADNNAQKTAFSGQATNAFYKRLFNQTQCTESINRFAKFLAQNTGDEFLIDTLGNRGNTVSLSTVKSLPPIKYTSPMTTDTTGALYNIEDVSGINEVLIRHYAQKAERKPFFISDKMTAAADIADLKEDCRVIMKYQQKHKVGYKKGDDLIFSWARVKRNLKINDLNPNPSEKEIKLARELKADAELRAAKRAEYHEEQNKSQPKTSTWDKIKKFFGG